MVNTDWPKGARGNAMVFVVSPRTMVVNLVSGTTIKNALISTFLSSESSHVSITSQLTYSTLISTGPSRISEALINQGQSQ